ncbi:acidic fibroblast growth factor intracellular-binding protein-like isoform X2 [Corticium candelabrum]|uniref:acidic fibroblast growth factor intracellular-binding protein-like isoform X2 n=1 Tax=Corticium candelabrum TaxID=121492 RepID=UPI002E267B73|nr:acidic fibroblast growth factor intracellular-binding protein-like isoform X2 [Corticium candelabrum]
MPELSVFVSDPALIDKQVFHLWLCGLTVEKAVSARLSGADGRQPGVTENLLRLDTKDQFATFVMLEHYLQQPLRLDGQRIFQLPPNFQQELIQIYYSFDEAVVRELLGKKFSSRQRKDLDDIEEKSGVPLRSCRRQFDNMKRIYKAVEDVEGSLVESICRLFLLPEVLARKYACIVFMTSCRFEVGKKRLAYLSFDDFAFCTHQMMEHWTSRSKGDAAVDLDRTFLRQIADLKGLMGDKESLEQYRVLVASKLAVQEQMSKEAQSVIGGNFRTLFKALLKIGEGLIHSKELKDFFSDLVEKFIEPCRSLDLGLNDVDALLMCAIEVNPQLDVMRKERVQRVFVRYMTTVKSCILQMHQVGFQ